MPVPRILLTPGEPAGIGPDITINLAQQTWPAELIAIADPDLLLQRAALLKLPLKFVEFPLSPAFTHAPKPREPGTLNIIPVRLNQPVTPGKLDTRNAAYVMETLAMAATLCEKKEAQAVVTGPVHKGLMNQANIAFSGHTEFFAQHANVPHTVMLFVTEQLKVALATTHVPLKKVSSTLTKDLLRLTLTTLNEGLKKQFHIERPRILVCGLNPHAGEGGYLGREEIETLTPVIETLRQENYRIQGPLPADTVFTPNYLREADVILSMYHDQALPLIKYISFGHAVNVTLGLPYVRTSVDHGTAADLAGTGTADPGSMQAALQLAIKLVS